MLQGLRSGFFRDARTFFPVINIPNARPFLPTKLFQQKQNLWLHTRQVGTIEKNLFPVVWNMYLGIANTDIMRHLALVLRVLNHFLHEFWPDGPTYVVDKCSI